MSQQEEKIKMVTEQEILEQFSRDVDNVDKVLTKEIHMRTLDFEKAIIALQKLSLPLQIGRKMQVIIHYDPQEPSVAFKYFTLQE